MLELTITVVVSSEQQNRPITSQDGNTAAFGIPTELFETSKSHGCLSL